jgi:hypothetical protein
MIAGLLPARARSERRPARRRPVTVFPLAYAIGAPVMAVLTGLARRLLLASMWFVYG